MVKTIKLDKKFYAVGVLILLIIILLVHVASIHMRPDVTNIEVNKELNVKNEVPDKESPQPNITIIAPPPQVNQPMSTPTIQNTPQQMNALDRVTNPLRYPYKSDYFYDQRWYPSLELPFQVVGCGSRNQPCLGGTQVPIYNPPTPIDISDNNIAPVYISTRGPLGQPQQVGIIYKIYGDNNDVYPLFGRKKYPNGNRYEYYTVMGSYGVKVPVITKNKYDEVGTNDIVFVQGRTDPYRATIYKSDYPSYIPYL